MNRKYTSYYSYVPGMATKINDIFSHKENLNHDRKVEKKAVFLS